MIASTSNIYSIMLPPAPLLLEQAAKDHSSMIIQALGDLGARLKAWNVAAAVVVSDQWRSPDSFFIDTSAQHQTNSHYPLPGDSDLAKRLLNAGKKNLLFPEAVVYGLDAAITVPLQFLFPQGDVPVVPLSMGLSPLHSFRWGRTIGEVLRREKGNFLFLTTVEPSCSLIAFLKQRSFSANSLFQEQISNLLMTGESNNTCSSLFMLFGLLGIDYLKTMIRIDDFLGNAWEDAVDFSSGRLLH
ncbi:MAG: hypothetical protein E6713_11900 [Sporomusaceae bacterium]|nr:hypothetical protein [Sporomusaceae bacterium]